jgi:hypothetical protein
MVSDKFLDGRHLTLAMEFSIRTKVHRYSVSKASVQVLFFANQQALETMFLQNTEGWAGK